MSYDDKIRAARDIVNTHNANVEEKSKVDFDAFLDQLRKAGGTTEAALKFVSFEDLEKWDLPRLIAQQVAKTVFRDDGDNGKKESGYISTKKAVQLSYQELLERYDPKDADNPVGERLAKVSRGKKVVVFNDDGSVDIPSSLKLLQEVRDGYPERDMFVEEGKAPRHIFKIGDRPDCYEDKNPIYKGRVLRPDESCDQTNRSWKGISLEARQIVYLATRETGELKSSAAHDIIDLALDDNGKLRQRCPKAVLLLKERRKTNEDPTLKIPRSATGVGQDRRQNNPFNAHKKF